MPDSAPPHQLNLFVFDQMGDGRGREGGRGEEGGGRREISGDQGVAGAEIDATWSRKKEAWEERRGECSKRRSESVPGAVRG